VKRVERKPEQVTDRTEAVEHDPRPTLVALGAPLMFRAQQDMSLEDAVARSLRLMYEDATVLLSLPVVLAMNEDELDEPALRRKARELGVEAELGMVLDLTAELAGRPRFHSWTDGLQAAEPAPRYLAPPRAAASYYQRRLADERTPPVVARWGFRVNTSEGSFRQFFAKHHG
jgi:hypothetical protein